MNNQIDKTHSKNSNQKLWNINVWKIHFEFKRMRSERLTFILSNSENPSNINFLLTIDLIIADMKIYLIDIDLAELIY